MDPKHTSSDGPRQEGRKRTRKGANGNGAGGFEGLHAGPAKIRANLSGAVDYLADHPETAELFSFNAMTGKIMLDEGPPWSDSALGYPRALEDADTLHCQDWLQRNGLTKVGDRATFGAMLIMAYRRAFHPMQDYFNALQWDGQKRLDTWLSYYAGVEPSDYVRQAGRMFMVSMAARALKPGCQADYVLVLEGKQRTGKSSLCRILGGDWYSGSLPPIGQAQFKDVQAHLRGLLVCEVPEIEAFRKADASALKAMISTPRDRYRAPYGRAEIDVPRTCVFIVTTNEQNYLTDHTGGTRFWPVMTTSFDLEALTRDRDQLFAEAVAAYRNGERWWPDEQFHELAAPEQADRLEEMPWLNAIASWLECQLQNAVTVQEVFELALKSSDLLRLDKRVEMQIANCLRALGWIKHRTNSRSLWRRPGT